MSIPRILILLVCFAFLGFTGGMIAEDALTVAAKPVPALVTADLRKPGPDYTLPLQYARLVIDMSWETDVPVWLLCRTFSAESSDNGNPLNGNWRTEAISSAGAEGVAQIMPANLIDFSKRYYGGKPFDPHDPIAAIIVGSRFLADKYATFKDWRRALGFYNAGFTPPAKWRNETIRYVRAILGE